MFDDGRMSLPLKPSWRVSGARVEDEQASAKDVVFDLVESDMLLVYEQRTAYFVDLKTKALVWTFDKYISVSTWGVVTNTSASRVWFTEDSNTVTIKHSDPKKKLVRLDMDLLPRRYGIPNQVTQCVLVRAHEASYTVVRSVYTNKVSSDYDDNASNLHFNFTGRSNQKFEKCLLLTKYDEANQAQLQCILYVPPIFDTIHVEDLTLLDDTATLVFAITLDGQKDVVQLDAETLAYQGTL